MSEEEEHSSRKKRRHRRKKRRRSGKEFKPLKESVIIFSIFVGLTIVVIACFWAIVPIALNYLQDTIGW
jgi:hypothetical protein